MKQLIPKILALFGVFALVGILWPIFTEAETSLAIIFVIASMVGIGLAAMSLFSRRRWLLWAALGVWPGALIGGLAFAGIAILTIGDTDHGFEGLVVGAVIILGVFIGAVAGGVTGAVLGVRKTRRENDSHRLAVGDAD